MTTPVINWNIVDLERNLSDGYVFTAHWMACCECDGNEASRYGSVSLEHPNNDFILFQDLTKFIVLDWIKNKLGTQEVSRIEQSLIAEINDKKTPAHAHGVPWSAN
jgi:hypothetical protein